MQDDDLHHEEIADLERQIEQLAGTAERCRKIMLISKAAITAGGVLILAMAVRAISFDASAMIGAITAVIGGIVVFGSNTSTWKQTEAALNSVEALRADLINKLKLRVIEEKRYEH